MNFPQRHVGAVQAMAARLYDSRKTGADLAVLARDLVRGLEDVCARTGLDFELDADAIEPAVVERLKLIELDGGSPRNQKPAQLAASVLGGAGLEVVDEPDRSISLGGEVRAAVVAQLAKLAETELAVPHVREQVIAEARPRTEERYLPVFDKIVAQLDDRGAQLVKTPKVPVDALHAVQRALTEGRQAVIAKLATTWLDGAKAVLGEEAAARLDQPIATRATPREVVILRAQDARVGLAPSQVMHSLIESLGELVPITWRAAEQQALVYGASKTFKVGDLVEHPKFGRGNVTAVIGTKVEVEFTDGKRSLAHTPVRR